MMNIIKKFKIDNSLYLFMLIGMLSGYIKDIVIVFFIVFMHEIGHVLFFTFFNIEIISIVIYPFGGMCYVNKKINNRILYDVLINFGGIFIQLFLFVIFYYLWKCGMIVDSTYNIFCTYNLSIILFNLLPIVPLDGSKLLVNLLCSYLPYRLSYLVMILVSIGVGFIFCIYNILFGINDLIIYGYLLFQLIKVVKEYKYVINKFYLERIIYDNYYNEIISGNLKVCNMKIGKYYYFYKNGRYYSEKEYLKKVKIL